MTPGNTESTAPAVEAASGRAGVTAGSRPEAVRVEDQPAPRLFGRNTILSIVITVALLGVMATMIDLHAVWDEIVKCDKGLALLGLIAHYSTYPVRGARWRRVLRHLDSRSGYLSYGLLVFFYNFVDNVVPAKLGDVYGAHLARINLGVRRSAALGSIVFQRMIDAWFVLVFAAVSSFAVFAETLPDTVLWALIFGGILAAATTLPLVLFGATNNPLFRKLPEALQGRIQSFRTGMWPRRREFATIAGLTIAIWGLETLWIFLLAASFGIHLGPMQVVFLTMIPLIASTFPLTPSGAGVVEASFWGCLVALGTPSTLAASVTVLNRLIDFWLHIALGLVVWAMRHQLGLRTWREVPIEEEPEQGDGEAFEPTA